MTQRQLFKKAMQKKGFEVSDFQGEPFQGNIDLIPFHRKTNEGHHNIITQIHFAIWGGSNVKKGDLGCVSFCYYGKQRRKFCKNTHSNEILLKSFCPKTALEAIKTYNEWSINSNKTINSWKVVL